MTAVRALTIPARCPRGHVLDRRTAVLASRTWRCAVCDRADCYRAHYGHEPPPDVLDPRKFKACGAGITAMERATFLSETTAASTSTPEQETPMSHSDPTSSAALRSVKRRASAFVQQRTTWRDHLDPYEVPRGDVERDEAAAIGLEQWRQQKAYLRWSHSRGDFGID